MQFTGKRRDGYGPEGSIAAEEDLVESISLKPTSLSAVSHHVPSEFLDSIAILFLLPGSTNSSDSSNQPFASPNGEDELNNGFPVDILFTWPKKSKSKTVEGLFRSQGMFSTLFRLLQDVTDSCPITSRVRLDQDDTHICYATDNHGESLLLLASRSQHISLWTLREFTERIVAAVSFKWGNLTRAFRGAHENEIGRLLSNTTLWLCSPKFENFLLMEGPSCRRSVVLVDSVLQQTEEIMYTFESSTFFEDDENVRAEGESSPNFHCVGSMLFFKNNLVASHLEKAIQHQLYWWLMAELSSLDDEVTWKSLKRLILWQPVHLRSGDHPTSVYDQHNPAASCHYAVVVGFENFILAFLLDPIGRNGRLVPPENRWIGEAADALDQLTRSGVGQHLKNEMSPTQESGGAVSNDCNQGSSRKQNFSASHSVDKQPFQNLTEDGANFYDERKEGFADDGTTTGSDASSAKLSADGSETLSSERIHGSFGDCPRENISLSTVFGANFVYSFVQIDNGRGVLVTPKDDNHIRHASIISNFRHHARISRQVLQRGKDYRMKLSTRAKDWKWINKAITPISEHGTFFECYLQDLTQRNKRKLKKINYWVVGRLYEEQREVYVCLHDSAAHQSAVEIAFKIANFCGS